MWSIMYKDIYEIIINRSDNNELLSVFDLEYIIDRLATSFNINSPFFDYEVHDDINKEEPRAYFDLQKGHIIFNIAKFREAYKNETCYITNVSQVYEIVHELTHVKQTINYKEHTIDDFEDPLERLEYSLDYMFITVLKTFACPLNVPTLDQMKILKDAFPEKNEEFYSRLNNMYDNLHDMIPFERIAEIRGLKFVLSLVQDNSIGEYREKEMILILNKCLYQTYLKGYFGNTYKHTPIGYFMNLFGYKNDINQMEELKQEITDKYDLDPETKMEYGLDINDKIKDYIQETRREYIDKHMSLSKTK